MIASPVSAVPKNCWEMEPVGARCVLRVSVARSAEKGDHLGRKVHFDPPASFHCRRPRPSCSEAWVAGQGAPERRSDREGRRRSRRDCLGLRSAGRTGSRPHPGASRPRTRRNIPSQPSRNAAAGSMRAARAEGRIPVPGSPIATQATASAEKERSESGEVPADRSVEDKRLMTRLEQKSPAPPPKSPSRTPSSWNCRTMSLRPRADSRDVRRLSRVRAMTDAERRFEMPNTAEAPVKKGEPAKNQAIERPARLPVLPEGLVRRRQKGPARCRNAKGRPSGRPPRPPRRRRDSRTKALRPRSGIAHRTPAGEPGSAPRGEDGSRGSSRATEITPVGGALRVALCEVPHDLVAATPDGHDAPRTGRWIPSRDLRAENGVRQFSRLKSTSPRSRPARARMPKSGASGPATA